MSELRLVRVMAPHFVAGFETDGVVRRAAPILKYLVGKTDDQARAYINSKGWRASVVENTSQFLTPVDESTTMGV